MEFFCGYKVGFVCLEKKTFALINRINVLISLNVLCTEMLWSQYSHFHIQVSALHLVVLAYKQNPGSVLRRELTITSPTLYIKLL